MDPTFVLAGRLRRDYLLPPTGRPLLDVPGGNLLYSAAGLGVWDNQVGLLARVGEDYPHEWLRSFEKRGWDTRGIHILAKVLDLRFFQAWLDLQTVQNGNPVAHFARIGLPFPKSLLGYQPAAEADDDRKTSHPDSPRPDDIPEDYLNAHAVHICPMDYVTAGRLLSAFRQASVTSITLDPSAAFMLGTALDDVRILLHGLTAFLPSEDELRALFWGRTDDLWQMAETLCSFGCEFIVIKRGARGQMLYDSATKKRWEIPAYPARPVDLSGAGDSFCGGFLAGYQKTYDPLQAVLHGGVSASLTIEGSGAFHALDALPGLAQARLDSLAGVVREV
ncbi:MAG TPA: carbohydrate kinase family protein [Anaerolineales bacterium]|nr:carbohydrate kinase family protein [Anaerolineales bacterium]